MTTNQTVKASRPRDGVVLLTLNRPERLNAVTLDLVDDLHEALDGLQKDPTCRVVVLTNRDLVLAPGRGARSLTRPQRSGQRTHSGPSSRAGPT